MNQDNLHLINKIFNNETIRTVWDKNDEKYYISIVDIAGVLSDSKEPRKYWNWLKNKLKKEENFEVSSITRQLKLKAQDGKYRETDVTDIEGMFRIIAAKQRPLGLNENIKVAKMGGHAAKVARDDIEKNLRESVVTKDNKLNYKYIEDTNKILKKDNIKKISKSKKK